MSTLSDAWAAQESLEIFAAQVEDEQRKRDSISGELAGLAYGIRNP